VVKLLAVAMFPDGGFRSANRLSDNDYHDRLIPTITGYVMELLDRITVNPNQCGGHPCIRGMRIRVKDVLELLAAGVSETEILKDYPYLEQNDIRAVLAFAAEQADHPVLRTA
jgi:uncharacterized protein (DUF433 family)